MDEAEFAEAEDVPADVSADVPEHDEPPRPPKRRSRGLIAAGLLGVEQALYGYRRNEIVMVADANGMPEPDFDVQLTPDPRDSFVILRKYRKHRRA